MLKRASENMNRYEENLSEYACKNSAAYRLHDEDTKNDPRSPFFRDIDRVIYSLAYTRYIDKTQVFSFNENDHITKRMMHVQMVAKIARTIGRALKLNEDLIEAAALGHDLGHVPFGHEGEYILNRISQENNEGFFNHNIQSVRNLMDLEDDGKGKNLTIQVLDAIMCHNGEFLLDEYHPKEKTKETFLAEYESSYTDPKIIKKLVPMTLEGCVVRISDIIAYIGKDIEDAIRLNVLKEEELPKDIVRILGVKNRNIVNTIILDVIENSLDKPYLRMSPEIFNAVLNLKKYNYENIYAKALTEEDRALEEKMLRTVFDKCLNDLNENKKDSEIYQVYINDMEPDYIKSNSNARIVIDYIAGMTDDYLANLYKKYSEK